MRAKARLAEAHTRSECALHDHSALGRYLRQAPNERLAVDRTKIRAGQRLDGNYLRSTSDPSLSAEDVALGYKNLLEAGHGFRDLKGILELRPLYHRNDVEARNTRASVRPRERQHSPAPAPTSRRPATEAASRRRENIWCLSPRSLATFYNAGTGAVNRRQPVAMPEDAAPGVQPAHNHACLPSQNAKGPVARAFRMARAGLEPATPRFSVVCSTS